MAKGDSYWTIARKEAGAQASNKEVAEIVGHLQITNGNKILIAGSDIKA